MSVSGRKASNLHNDNIIICRLYGFCFCKVYWTTVADPEFHNGGADGRGGGIFT